MTPSATWLRPSRLCLLLTAACIGCGGLVPPPSYERADLPAKQSWSRVLSSEQQIDLKWWQGFGDPTLNGLVAHAIEGNPTLDILAARSQTAGTQIRQARARLLPILNVGGRTDTTDISGATDLGTSTKVGTGGDLLWELDIWGKARRGVAAQKAAYAASEADWRAGYLVTVAAVADAYFQIRQTDQLLKRQDRSLARGEEILKFYRQMHRRGLVPETRVLQQGAEVDQLEASRLELLRLRAVTENALATLTGQVAGDFAVPPTADFPELLPLALPAGLPSELLSRRPDLVAAEYRLLQAVQLESQARLAQLPTVGLTGLGGSASYGLSDLLKTWTAGLSSVVQFPVFNPNVRAQIKVSEAQVGEAEAQYRAAVFAAFEEVETVLVNLESRNAQQRTLEKRLDQLELVQRRTLSQLELGLISRLEVLERERTLLAAEQAVLATRWRLASDTVALFKAMGGGWDPEEVAATAGL